MKAVITIGFKRKQSVRKQSAETKKTVKHTDERESTVADVLLFSTSCTFAPKAKMEDVVNTSMERGIASLRNAFIAYTVGGKKLPSSLYIKVEVMGKATKIYRTDAVVDHLSESMAKTFSRIALSKADREANDPVQLANAFAGKFRNNIKAATTFVALEQQTDALANEAFKVDKADRFAIGSFAVNAGGDIHSAEPEETVPAVPPTEPEHIEG